MAWSSPRTWISGELVSDVMMNLHVRDQLSALKNDQFICQGRMTLTSGVPVTAADVTAATTIRFTPYIGNRIAVFDAGGQWQVLTFSELSLGLGSDTANTNYDLFAYDNSGAVALERLAWSSSTARATAIVLQDGVPVKSGDPTRRYLGTYRTTGTAGQTEDSAAKRFVWNYYNRQMRALRALASASSWTYTTETWRQANNSSSHQVEVVIGAAEVTLYVMVVGNANNAGGTPLVGVAICEDGTTAPSTGQLTGAERLGSNSLFRPVFAHFHRNPSIGYHFYAWIEISEASGTTTWAGTGLTTLISSGMSGTVEG